MSLRPCAIVPSHNHHKVLPQIVTRLRQMGLPVLIVDDGSAEPARSAIAALADPAGGIVVERLAENRGKGAAVIAGFRWALARGFTHALQVDADGQHDLDRVADFLALARTHPDALISGEARYDSSVPVGRRIGRWVTHVWVFIETLSLRISDSMCGFRLYPLPAVERLLAEETIGARMDFDTDIMVRLFWRGVPPVMVPVRVTYPAGNTSNFDVLADNWRITAMHTRLFFAMLARLPSILRHRPPPLAGASRWSSLGERGTYWGLCFVAAAYRLLGRRGCVAVMAPIVFYFYATSAERRRASRDFLTRAFAARGRRPPGWWDGYRHFMCFAERALDGFAAWIGAIRRDALVADTPVELSRLKARPDGALLVVSHVGNVELCRALLDPGLRARLTVLVHTRHAENYNRVIREFQPDAAARTMQVTEIGPEAAIQLGERIERGEWVAIAGDRIPVAAGGRVVRVPFLGAPAAFSQGPWLLAGLLGCPIILLFCRKEGDKWRLSLEDFAPRVVLPRGAREAAIAELAARYAGRLEEHCLADPLQWGNFYDFWAQGDAA